MGLKTLSSSQSEEEDAEILAEINITPLTDIFLVLLIIFMVTSSVMSQLGVDVDLPSASSSLSEAQPEGVVLTLLPQGGMKVNDIKIPTGDWARLRQALQRSFEVAKSKLVIIEGDRKAFLGSAIEVMDQARRAGAQQFAIATQPAGS